MNGFGWNFYGFFVFCILWIGGYFLWARSRQRTERGAGGEPADGRPPNAKKS